MNHTPSSSSLGGTVGAGRRRLLTILAAVAALAATVYPYYAYYHTGFKHLYTKAFSSGYGQICGLHEARLYIAYNSAGEGGAASIAVLTGSGRLAGSTLLVGGGLTACTMRENGVVEVTLFDFDKMSFTYYALDEGTLSIKARAVLPWRDAGGLWVESGFDRFLLAISGTVRCGGGWCRYASYTAAVGEAEGTPALRLLLYPQPTPYLAALSARLNGHHLLVNISLRNIATNETTVASRVFTVSREAVEAILKGFNGGYIVEPRVTVASDTASVTFGSNSTCLTITFHAVPPLNIGYKLSGSCGGRGGWPSEGLTASPRMLQRLKALLSLTTLPLKLHFVRNGSGYTYVVADVPSRIVNPIGVESRGDLAYGFSTILAVLDPHGRIVRLHTLSGVVLDVYYDEPTSKLYILTVNPDAKNGQLQLHAYKLTKPLPLPLAVQLSSLRASCGEVCLKLAIASPTIAYVALLLAARRGERVGRHRSQQRGGPQPPLVPPRFWW